MRFSLTKLFFRSNKTLSLLLGLFWFLNVEFGLAKTWIWQGALMPTSIRFSVKTDELGDEEYRLVAKTEDDKNLVFGRRLDSVVEFKDVASIRSNDATTNELIHFNATAAQSFHMVLEGLQPNKSYTWSATGDVHGRFQTPPLTGTAFNFTFAFASCANNDSNHVIFSLIPHNLRPLFMIHMGDLHYGNINEDKFDVYSHMYDRTLLRSNQAHMFQQLPTVYMWDDHDFGPNSTFGYAPSHARAFTNLTRTGKSRCVCFDSWM